MLKSNLPQFIELLQKGFLVIGPVKKENTFIFDKIENADDLALDYDTTILPAKKFLFPSKDPLFGPTIYEPPSIALFGLHPCDIIGIDLLDKVFYDGYRDALYIERRRNMIIIGLRCQNKCNNFSFCDIMQCYKAEGGFDIMLTELKDRYMVEIGSKKGADLIDSSIFKPPQEEDYAQLSKIKEDIENIFSKREMDFAHLADDLRDSYNSDFWQEHAKPCFGCGVCNVVCPTCYCFDICDTVDMGLSCAERTKHWDGCLLQDFAVVAGGDNFRKERFSRLRHRELRKGCYLPQKYNYHTYCVGCGRCVKSCLAHISPLDAFKNAQTKRK